MSYKFQSEKEDPRSPDMRAATREPAHVVWARQFPAPNDIPKPPPAHEVFAKQFPSKLPKGTHKEPAHKTWARQFTPKPAAVPPRAAIPETFATARTPQPGSHLRLLNGMKGCAVPSGIVDRIKSLLRRRDLDALAEARGLIEKLPADHPHGMSLVREAYELLIALTNTPHTARRS
jgi:hypothetical protein